MPHLGKKSTKTIRHLGRKSINAGRSLGKKLPQTLSKLGGGLQAAGAVGELASGALMMAGQPELAGPLMMASEAAKYGGKALGGASKATQQAKDGNILGAAITVQKTAVDASKNKAKFKKKYA
jgi:fructose 1,6-bisphosphatase